MNYSYKMVSALLIVNAFRTLVIFSILLQIACSGLGSQRMNSLQVGMTKEQVIKIMGEPYSTSAQLDVEYVKYNLDDNYNNSTYNFLWGGIMRVAIAKKSIYYIKLVQGKVDSYGRIGDFDSAKVPETKHTIDIHIDK